MTLDEAESIIMAVEVGKFRGSASECAQALLMIAARPDDEKEEAQP